MANIGNDYITYSDLAKKLIGDGNAKIGTPIEMLAKNSPMINDIPLVECNNGTSHLTLLRSGLPEGEWRSINQGVDPSKSETVQVEDKCAQLASRFQVDEDLVNLHSNKAAFMANEEEAHLEGQTQQMEKALIYGKGDKETGIKGLAVRYAGLDDTVDPAYGNVVDGRPSTDTSTDPKYTSAYLVTWGPKTVHGIHPKGLPGGFHRRVNEFTDIADRDGKEFPGYKVYYKWNLGLAVRDWRSIVRLANINGDSLTDMVDNGAATSPQQAMVRLMIMGASRVPSFVKGRQIWYMNTDTVTMLSLIAMEKSNVWLSIGEFEGRPVRTFLGVPIHVTDALTFDEFPVV